jgi:superfamily II DNA or RNA helicase
MFSKIIFKLRPRYIFGLTATLERKDKLEKVIKWYIGDVLFSNISNEKKQQTEIHVYKFNGKSSVEKTLKDGTVAVSSMLTEISQDSERINLIKSIIFDLTKNNQRQILVCSDRTLLLKKLNKIIGDTLSGLFIGETKPQHREESKNKQVLLGTYQMVSEGFNLPKLNCVIFATPRSNITQAIGRIFRKKHLITPVIVDIVDTFSIFQGQYYKRRNVYKKSIENCLFVDNGISNEISLRDEIQECLIED